MKESIKHELDKSEKPAEKDWMGRDKPADAKPVAKKPKAEVKMVIPSGGTMIAANPGYWVMTASDSDDPAVPGIVFGRPRSVVAWVVGATDTSTPPFPITVRPFEPGIETIAIVDMDGSVIGLDNVHYGSTDEWKAAVTAAAAAAAAEAAAPPPPAP